MIMTLFHCYELELQQTPCRERISIVKLSLLANYLCHCLIKHSITTSDHDIKSDTNNLKQMTTHNTNITT